MEDLRELPGDRSVDAAVAFVKKKKGQLTAEQWHVLYRAVDDGDAFMAKLRELGLVPKS